MCRTEQDPDREQDATAAAFTALLEDSAEELYEHAPCGYLSTLMDGTIAKINTTLLNWLGLDRSRVVGRMRFTDLLTVGGKLYHETHFAPLLQMKGEIGGIALDIKSVDGTRMPVLVTSKVKTSDHGEPLLIRTSVFDARDRRAYEKELLRSRQVAEEARRQAEADRERLQEALAVLQQSLLPAELPQVPGLEASSYYHTASPTCSAETSTICSPSARIGGRSSSATCAAKAPRPPRSPHSPATPCGQRPCTTPTPSPCSPP